MSKPTPPQTLKGFRDILPTEKRQRQFVETRLQAAFERFGFAPLETPTLEYAELLLGKYGTEADKLVYTFADRGDRQIGLRYDQTVPTARVLVQYQHLLPSLFRRYQLQNVFRADKPQKGRYREFRQCDCDIYGTSSPIADAEIIAVYYAAFREVGFTTLRIELNDRQTLMSTLSPFATPEVNVASIIQSIDKLDKLTSQEVAAELTAKGLTSEHSSQIVAAIEKAEKSDNLKQIEHYAHLLGVPKEALVFNPKIARGLDYYTGLIFEGKIPEYSGGSVGGGGRYDHLVEQLAGVAIPAVGFGIGFDRTVEAAVELGLIPETKNAAKVLVTLFDTSEAAIQSALEIGATLRSAAIATEIYPTPDKLAKQMKVANQKHIPWVVICGDDERAQAKVAIKNMATGEQSVLTIDQALQLLAE